MIKNFKWTLVLVLSLFGLTAAGLYQDKLFEISKNLEIFTRIYKELNSGFVDDLDPNILMKTAIDAMVNSLDPYTNYVTESQVESYRISQDDRYQGIGARVGLIDKEYTIIEPYAGGPAAESGLKAGDKIIAIDGISIKEKTIEEINTIIRGIPGTDVNLTIVKPGKKEEIIKLTRGEVNIPNVPYSGMVSPEIGYINLTTFTANASGNIKNAFKELKTKNPSMKGVILDLRQNGGGLLSEAVNICNLFLPQGEVVVTTKGKVKENDQTFKTMTAPMDLEIPVAVLIDKRSASASEIVSGVIQDMDRGVIIGQRSFGKGLVQNTKNTGYNSILKLTTSKYYIPSGRCIQGVEYENGFPKDIPDEKRSKFKTKNGRTVLDGGGVTPDVKLTPVDISELTIALLEKNMIFHFVTQYVLSNDSIEEPEKFVFDDFTAFEKFCKDKNFTYQTSIEKNLAELKNAALKSNQKDIYNSDIVNLENKIKQEKEKSWSANKKEILREIEKEIVSRYYYQSGKVRYSLQKDAEISEAVSLLTDHKKYQKILKK
ncbi:MAG: S41 family peptidase [Saprospiraceae bacterium]|nr:S41 family peptidase [Saprospiraceae bacterium]MBK9044445.1 S41 family peptidase [Saprospiraceae bacterium]MBP6695085.1 S41 family peptidase [Saprospiraceae bacterium]